MPERERALKSQRKDDGERIRTLEQLVKDRGEEVCKLHERISSITKACEGDVEIIRKDKQNVELGT